MADTKIKLKTFCHSLGWVAVFEEAYQKHQTFLNYPVPLSRQEYLMGLTEGITLLTKYWQDAAQRKIIFRDGD